MLEFFCILKLSNDSIWHHFHPFYTDISQYVRYTVAVYRCSAISLEKHLQQMTFQGVFPGSSIGSGMYFLSDLKEPNTIV